jgi:hypothetical protein
MERPRRSLEQALREAGHPNQPPTVATRPSLPPWRRPLSIDREGQDAEPGAGGAGETPPPTPEVPSARPLDLRATLRSRAALRQAFLLREILGPPIALRGPHDGGR